MRGARPTNESMAPEFAWMGGICEKNWGVLDNLQNWLLLRTDVQGRAS